MAEHLSAELLEGYRRRRLEPAQLLAIDDHLATCSLCRYRLREMSPRHGALRALQASLQTENQADEHLTDGHLQAYVEGRLDAVDLELTENHLESCNPCSARAEQCRVSVQRIEVTPTPRPALLDRIAAGLSLSIPVPASLRVAGAVLLVLALFGAAALWLRTDTEQRQVVVQHQERSPQAAPSTPIVVELNDGGAAVALDAQGNLRGLDSLTPADRRRIREVLTTQQIEVPATVRELRDSSAAMMGSPVEAGFSLLSPFGRMMATDRPVFRWRPLEGAISYQVTVTNPAAGHKEVAASQELRDTEWRVARPLERGRLYTWQVIARTGTGEVKAPAPDAPEARFRILDQAKADEIASAEKTHAGKHLVMGVIYAEAGLVDEADRELSALAAANPESTDRKSNV